MVQVQQHTKLTPEGESNEKKLDYLSKQPKNVFGSFLSPGVLHTLQHTHTPP